MKKLISMVMAAAMVVSLVPATAFAANEATFKVVKDAEYTKAVAEKMKKDKKVITGPEVQLKIRDVDSKLQNANKADEFDVTLTFENAEVKDGVAKDTRVGAISNTAEVLVKDEVKAGDDSIDLIVKETNVDLAEDDVIPIDLGKLDLILTKSSVGTKATVEVSGDFGTSEDLVFVSVLDKGLDVSVKKTVDVAVEETATIKDITIEPAVGDTIGDAVKWGGKISFKLNKGFEFAEKTFTVAYTGGTCDESNNEHKFTATSNEVEWDDSEFELSVGNWEATATKLVFKDIKVEATSAKSGAVATITVDGTDVDSTKVEVAKVIDNKVALEVDEDEDVPVYYSGTDVNNYGLTVDDDHESLEVTLKETFAGAWNMNKEFKLELPEGVYVTAVDASDVNGTLDKNGVTLYDAFKAAYQEGDHENFVFEKRTFDNTDPDDAAKDDEHEMTFTLTLVADPDFEGDVKLKLTGDNVDEQEVTIAKFVKPYTVKAEQNDLKIDYRYTAIPTNIVITEAEAGLWDDDKAAEFTLELDKDVMDFEDDAEFKVDDKSGLEIDDDTKKGTLTFEVTESSGDEPATVTIGKMALFMNRNIPAGPYDLLISTSMDNAYEAQMLFAPDHTNCPWNINVNDGERMKHDNDKECYVTDVCDFSDVAKEAFVNVVTAGREDDDASFTTKVVVPVGEKYIIAGEKQIALDVPAYVSAAGYTMLPVRAVATALGINNNNVLWDQATRTVTIMYGQRIITMSAGEKVVYVNGSAIPAAAKVEIKDNRTFLPMRDLATALGVTDITWDAATKTATLNGNQGK